MTLPIGKRNGTDIQGGNELKEYMHGITMRVACQMSTAFPNGKALTKFSSAIDKTE